MRLRRQVGNQWHLRGLLGLRDGRRDLGNLLGFDHDLITCAVMGQARGVRIGHDQTAWHRDPTALWLEEKRLLHRPASDQAINLLRLSGNRGVTPLLHRGCGFEKGTSIDQTQDRRALKGVQSDIVDKATQGIDLV